ncbi:MAG: SDR family oxidoreductase [Selenomonadaceae bacterium]|nr:SDR family oxidoreductase [Selenomonadaceae bacterium]
MKKIVIITGGTSGIGLATAKKFLSQNYNCVIVGRDEKKFRDLKINDNRLKFISADVGNVESCNRVVSETVKIFGGVDTLINCAGIYVEGAINFVQKKTFDEVFNTNVKGTFFMCKAVVDELIKTRGTIVNVASDAGVHGNYFCALYAASKGAVIAFTKSLALELASLNVRVNCVAPADIWTPLTQRQLEISGESVDDLAKLYPLGRIGTAEEVAESIYFLASEYSSFITGEILNVNGGLC